MKNFRIGYKPSFSTINAGGMKHLAESLDTIGAKEAFDDKSMKGRAKIFEVRRLHNDITFLDEFFTFDFCVEQKFSSFGWNDKASTYEIQTREFAKVKEQLLRSLTNRGQPFIYVEDGTPTTPVG